MKNKLLFVVFPILTAAVGCSTTPRHTVSAVPVNRTNYTVAQAPVKVEVENNGQQWRSFVRSVNAERLQHNLRMAEIEHRAAEVRRAKELGVQAPTAPAATSPLGQMGQTTQQGGATYYVPIYTSPSYYYSPSYSYDGGGSGYWGGAYLGAWGSAWSGLGRGYVGKTPRWQSTPGYRHLYYTPYR